MQHADKTQQPTKRVTRSQLMQPTISAAQGLDSEEKRTPAKLSKRQRKNAMDGEPTANEIDEVDELDAEEEPPLKRRKQKRVAISQEADGEIYYPIRLTHFGVSSS